MFYKYLLKQEHLIKLESSPLESFSFTELIDEPSLLHSHTKSEIIVPLNSNGYLQLNDRKINLKVNQILLINPEVMHTEKNNKIDNQNLQYFSIKINLLFLSDEDFIVLNLNDEDRDIILYLKKAYESLSKKDNEELAILNLSCFYISFIDLINKNNLLSTNIKDNKIPFYVKDAKKYIEYNYAKYISIANLSEKYGICETLFCNKFKEFLGLTPNKYLIKIRIQNSMHLLITTNYSISQIAMLCGFKSPAHFTKSFKQATNILPKFYRDNH